MEMLNAIVLGIVDSLTQLFPVSGQAHALILGHWFTLDSLQSSVYSAVLPIVLGGVTLIYLWNEVWRMVQAVLRRLSRLPVSPRDLIMAKSTVLGSVPVIITSVVLVYFPLWEKVGLVASGLAGAALFMMYCEWRYYNQSEYTTPTARSGFMIGLFQFLAIIPGFPRASATMLGGMLLGLSRYESVRFSLLTFIPAAFVTGTIKMIDLIRSEGNINWSEVVIISSLIAGAIFVGLHFFVSLMRRGNLWPFVWYNLILAALLGYLAFII